MLGKNIMDGSTFVSQYDDNGMVILENTNRETYHPTSLTLQGDQEDPNWEALS